MKTKQQMQNFSMKRPTLLLAWLILKPLGIFVVMGGFVALLVLERGTLSIKYGDPETAQRLKAILIPWMTAVMILICKVALLPTCGSNSYLNL